MSNHYARSGFTLVELLISIAIFIAIMFVVTVATRDAFRSLAESREQQALLEETRQAVDRATDLIRHATTLLPLYIDPAGTTLTTDTDTVILNLPALDTNFEPIVGAHDVIVLDYAAPTVTITTYAHPSSRRTDRTETLTELGTSLVVRYYGFDPITQSETTLTTPILFATARRVEVELATSRSLPNHTLESQLTGTARLRNTL